MPKIRKKECRGNNSQIRSPMFLINVNYLHQSLYFDGRKLLQKYGDQIQRHERNALCPEIKRIKIATDVFRLHEISYYFILKNIWMERKDEVKIRPRQSK